MDPEEAAKFVRAKMPDVSKASALSREIASNQRHMDEVLKNIYEPQRLARDAKVQREKQSLELSEALLEQQRLLVESHQQMLEVQRRLAEAQEQQGEDARVDRRIQYAVLVVAIVALVTAATLPVALETNSIGWSVLVGVVTLLATSAVATVIVRGRRRAEVQSAQPPELTA